MFADFGIFAFEARAVLVDTRFAETGFILSAFGAWIAGVVANTVVAYLTGFAFEAGIVLGKALVVFADFVRFAFGTRVAFVEALIVFANLDRPAFAAFGRFVVA